MPTPLLIFCGPPGAGKGTQANFVMEKLGKRGAAIVTHLSSGDILRDELATETERAKVFTSYVNRGKLVPDKIVAEMVFDRLMKSKTVADSFSRSLREGWNLISFPAPLADNTVDAVFGDVEEIDSVATFSYNLRTASRSDITGSFGGDLDTIDPGIPYWVFSKKPAELEVRLSETTSAPPLIIVLDGFPRRLSQSEMLDKFAKENGFDIQSVLFFNVTLECLTERILKRADGSNGYSHRSDDTADTIKTRYDEYLEHTLPIISYYRKSDLLVEIDGGGKPEEVTQKVMNAIDKIGAFAG